MFAHWLQRAEGSGRFGYGIRVSRRDPQRAVWKEVHGICLDEPVDYAGFFTFAPGSGGAAYLSPPPDAPKPPPQASHNHDDDHGHRKTARFVSFRTDGSVEYDREIDADACSCCQTAAGRTRDGWIVAYRDHGADEVRDIAVIRSDARGAWTAPKPLHRDGWKINACPTDGPSMAVMEGRETVAIAWLTRAGDSPKVQLVFSGDQGESFGRPVRVDDGNPLGRPNVVALDRSRVLVTWLEKTGANSGVEVRMRVVDRSGKAGSSSVVAGVPVGRNSGFPKVAVAGRDILVAWKDGTVRVAVVPLSLL
jgi:hypothetical protein